MIFGIEKIEYKLATRIKNEQDFRFKEIKALEILKEYFPRGYIFETEFTLSFQTIQHIANDIIINKPKRILEIGSGLSTVILNNIISELDYDLEFISIDQDEGWQKLLFPQCNKVNFLTFNLTSNNEFSFEGKGEWFDLPPDSELRNKKYDLIIIDGPKGFESKYARFGIVEFLKGRIHESAIIFVDDTHREDEKFIVHKLLQNQPFLNSKSYLKYSRLSSDTLFFTSPS